MPTIHRSRNSHIMPNPESLAEALDQSAIVLPPETIDVLDTYCQLLWKWNEKLNLTRHTDYDLFVRRDIVDTIELSALIGEGEDVLDVGSGGGVPGITLALLRPDLKISLAESVGKRARVLDDIVAKLKLPTTVYNARAEAILDDDQRFDVVTARAVGALWKICFWFEPHWFSLGRLYCLKGPRWPDERVEAEQRGLLRDVTTTVVSEYSTPHSDARNFILELRLPG